MMKKEILYSDKPLLIGDITLNPLVRLSTEWYETNGLIFFQVTQQPVYILVSSPNFHRVINTDGKEISIHQVKKEYPALLSGFPQE